MKYPLPQLMAIAIGSIGFTSCASMKELSHKTASLTRSAKPGDIESMYSQSSFRDLFHRQQPKVVQVRQRDLKRQPSGHQLAQSHERKSRYRIVGGPVDFQEPLLNDSPTILDGSLLPPR